MDASWWGVSTSVLEWLFHSMVVGLVSSQSIAVYIKALQLLNVGLLSICIVDGRSSTFCTIGG